MVDSPVDKREDADSKVESGVPEQRLDLLLEQLLLSLNIGVVGPLPGADLRECR